MSVILCDKHDRKWDSDKLDECPLCENEHALSKPVWNKLWKCWLIPDPQNAALSIRVMPQVFKVRRKQVTCTDGVTDSVLSDETTEYIPKQDYDALRLWATARIAELEAELAEARADAGRYRWLRSQTWDKYGLCVVWNTTDSVKLGTDCPSHNGLDAAIDAAKEPR